MLSEGVFCVHLEVMVRELMILTHSLNTVLQATKNLVQKSGS